MHLTAFLFSFQTLRVRLQKPKHPVHVAKSRESLDASTSTAHTANGKRRRSDATKDDVPSDAAETTSKKRAKRDDGDKSPDDAAAEPPLPDNRRRSPPGVHDEHYALISASEHPLHPDHNASPLFELGAIPSWDLAGAGSWRHGPGSVCSGMQSSFMGGFPGDYGSLGPGMGGAFSFENAHDDTVYPPHPEGDAAAEIGPSPRSILLRNGERRRSGHVHFEGGRAILHRDSYDVAVELDISDFSSLIMGAVTFKKLYEFDRALISNSEYIEQVSRIFRSDTQPICLTRF